MAKIPIRIVQTNPFKRPAFLKASGIAKIPVPNEPFNMCIKVSVFLEKKKLYEVVN